jgi:hypothetical protein
MRDAQPFNILVVISSQHGVFLGNVLYFLSQLHCSELFLYWASFQEMNLLELSNHFLSVFVECLIFQ